VLDSLISPNLGNYRCHFLFTRTSENQMAIWNPLKRSGSFCLE
jgi:hypothetical protein